MDRLNLLIGYCHMRQATRTFRVDRIHRCIDTETGEVLRDIAAFLERRFQASPVASLHRLRDSDLDFLRILLFVAKADGQFRAQERALVTQACQRLAGDDRLTEETVRHLLEQFDIPTLAAFRLAVGRASALPFEKRLMLLQVARDVVATQKTVDPAEAAALTYLEQRLV